MGRGRLWEGEGGGARAGLAGVRENPLPCVAPTCHPTSWDFVLAAVCHVGGAPSLCQPTQPLLRASLAWWHCEQKCCSGCLAVPMPPTAMPPEFPRPPTPPPPHLDLKGRGATLVGQWQALRALRTALPVLPLAGSFAGTFLAPPLVDSGGVSGYPQVFDPKEHESGVRSAVTLVPAKLPRQDTKSLF